MMSSKKVKPKVIVDEDSRRCGLPCVFILLSSAAIVYGIYTTSFSEIWETPSIPELRDTDETPFPVENVTIPAALMGRNVTASCSADRVHTLFFFHTDASHRKRRDLYRKTSLHENLKRRFHWEAVYFVALRNNSTLQQHLLQEGGKYGDIVQLQYEEHYFNLTYKFVLGMQWVSRHCSQAKLIAKLDDDVFFYPKQAVSFLQEYARSDDSMYCLPIKRKVLSEFYNQCRPGKRSGKHCDVVFTLQIHEIHAFCTGICIFFRRIMIGPLLRAAYYVPYVPADDVYVTNYLLSLAGFKMKTLRPNLTYDARGLPSFISLLHPYNESKFLTLWKDASQSIK
ncbi:N-acetyllactosaminide beta-1,3-N-acetylglucosaminyltransferase 3-like [Ornithodoros turicata]|uniref:N-acetyllactosaminide beta-1,3-N-acetylglucosaminyltransferase 3-like n=1 Tax=Ornithodoros turicata TaxID=34597 RepID=UPI00313A37A8